VNHPDRIEAQMDLVQLTLTYTRPKAKPSANTAAGDHPGLQRGFRCSTLTAIDEMLKLMGEQFGLPIGKRWRWDLVVTCMSLNRQHQCAGHAFCAWGDSLRVQDSR